jgi:hypothetical protein
LDSPKKIEPPPKPQDNRPPPPEPTKIDDEINKKAVTFKSIRQLKEDLGPLTEEIKVEMEEAAGQILTIVKTGRDSFLKFLQAQVEILNSEQRRRQDSERSDTDE